MADITSLNPPEPADEEPTHFNYRLEYKDGSTADCEGYLIVTPNLVMVCRGGFSQHATTWEQVARVYSV